VRNGALEQPTCPGAHICSGEGGTRRGGGGERIGKRGRAERLHRKAAVSMGVQVDEAGKREPARRRARRCLDCGDASGAQAHAMAARALREYDGIEPQIAHAQ